LRDYRQTGADPYDAQRPDQIAGFFEGLELTAPGVVPIGQWGPDPSPFTAPAVPVWGAAGTKT
jgi:hypothetical protein